MNKIGILGASAVWENVLCQLGIPCRVFKNQDELRLSARIDALILSSEYCVNDIAGLQAILGEKAIFIIIPAGSRKGKQLNSSESVVWKEEEYRFEVEIELFESERKCRANIVHFPIKLDDIPNDIVHRRQFYASRQELPSERINALAQFEILRFVRNFLIAAFRAGNRELWGYAGLPENKPLFIFRIDTDFAEEAEIRKLAELCSQYSISATWFVDVHSEQILQYYETFDDQEIALHCDRHYVYEDKLRNYDNLASGYSRLFNHKICPSGFAAPFGDWNRSLEEAIFELDFSYSSEFAYAWDTLPIIRKQKGKTLLQIPIHPISPGRLRRSHFSSKEMLDYFIARIEHNIRLGIPAIIYHHPAHGLLDLIEELLKYVRENNINNLSMHSYASWWLKRYEALSQSNISELIEPIRLEEQSIDLPKDYLRIYKKNWRWYLYEYESFRSRRYFQEHGYPAKVISR
ncbi:MAG: hypothetical protein K9M99_04020 [Candidatus Cloacimonetes bacterium]|nr:hypothetical protein [Candidatus Cloacimonadota bacterium]